MITTSSQKATEEQIDYLSQSRLRVSRASQHKASPEEVGRTSSE